jgi:hypothetical protein
MLSVEKGSAGLCPPAEPFGVQRMLKTGHTNADKGVLVRVSLRVYFAIGKEQILSKKTEQQEDIKNYQDGFL